MSKRKVLALIGGGLLLAVSGCDSGSSSLMAGTAGTVAAQTCTRSSDCTAQVCSPDGRCIDCFDDRDCRADQRCEAERCVAQGSATGGSSTAGSSGSGAGTGAAPGGGSGGGPSHPGQCGGAQVLLVIQRSGVMFEEPSEEESYFAMVKTAVTGDGGIASSFGDKVDLGALFFVRLQDEAMACPVVSSAAPQAAALMPLGDLFSGNESAYQALADEQAKMDAPVPEAIAAAPALLSGDSRHIVLITTAVPDSCALADSNCTVDLAIKAVQDAKSQGITTHVIGLGDTGSLDASDDDDGYATYLSQLANAGAGQPVAMSGAFDEQCGDEDATATYADTSGSAQAHRVESTAEIRSALEQILGSVCP